MVWRTAAFLLTRTQIEAQQKLYFGCSIRLERRVSLMFAAKEQKE